MIINNNAGSNIQKLSSSNVIRLEKPVSDNPVSNFLNRNRFDIFEIADKDTLSAEAKALKEKFLKEIENGTQEERNKVAVHAYAKMQSIITENIKAEKHGIEHLSQLQEERAYYQSLKENGGVIDEGKFFFSNLKDTVICKDTLESAINNNAQRINCLLGRNRNSANELQSRMFSSYAEMFSAATGKHSSALELDGNSLNNQTVRTEENFVSEARKNIESLTARSNGITELFNEYIKEQGGQGEESASGLLKNGDMLGLLSQIKQLQEELGLVKFI
jgi:hypothetical protein